MAGSDTHHYEQLGSVYNQFRQLFSTIPQLKALISTGAYTVCVNDNLPAMVGLARQEKLRLKQEKLDPTRCKRVRQGSGLVIPGGNATPPTARAPTRRATAPPPPSTPTPAPTPAR
ncbi:MAG: hypothetical protein IPL78_20670 [Chloroflexi bacterium]|nr:hypothetical protein [Chloroflexota bacterium]